MVGFHSAGVGLEVGVVEARHSEAVSVSRHAAARAALAADASNPLEARGDLGQDSGASPAYALRCVEACEVAAASALMDPTVGSALSGACSVVRGALYRELPLASAASPRLPKEFWRDVCGEAQAQLGAARAGVKRMQSDVSLARNQYLSLVRHFKEVEDRLELQLPEYQRGVMVQREAQAEVSELQASVEAESCKHETLLQGSEELARKLNQASQALYDATLRRRNVKLDIRAALEKSDMIRRQLEESDGRVPTHKWLAARDEIAAVLKECGEADAAVQQRQAVYVDVLGQLKRCEARTRAAGDALKLALEAELEAERALTPRPDWKDSIERFPFLAADEHGAGGRPRGRRNSLAGVASSSGAAAGRSGSLISSSGGAGRRASLDPSGEAAREAAAAAGSAPVQATGPPPAERRMSSVSRADADKATSASAPPKPRPSREAVQLLADEIVRLELDGPAVLEMSATLGAAQAELEVAKRELDLCHSFLPQVTSAPLSTPDAAAGAGATAVKWQSLAGSLQYEQNKKGELFVRALGRGASVPPFLRDEGMIQIRLIPRGELLELVNEVWAFKLGKDRASAERFQEQMGASRPAAPGAASAAAAGSYRSSRALGGDSMRRPSQGSQGSMRVRPGSDASSRWGAPQRGGGSQVLAPAQEGGAPSAGGAVVMQSAGAGASGASNSSGALGAGTSDASALPAASSSGALPGLSSQEIALTVLAPTMACSEAFFQILKNRYGLQKVISKWAYNVLFSLRQLAWDADLELFYCSLLGQVAEGTFVDQQTMLGVLQSQLRRAAALEGAGAELSKGSLFASLEAMFPAKTGADMDELELAVHDEQPLETVFLDLLLDEDQEPSAAGQTFFNLVKRQHLADCKRVLAELRERLEAMASKYADGDKCKLEDLVAALRRVDPTLTPPALALYLFVCFPEQIRSEADAAFAAKNGRWPQAPPEQSRDQTWVSVAQLLESLQRISYKPALAYVADPQPVVHKSAADLLKIATAAALGSRAPQA